MYESFTAATYQPWERNRQTADVQTTTSPYLYPDPDSTLDRVVQVKYSCAQITIRYENKTLTFAAVIIRTSTATHEGKFQLTNFDLEPVLTERGDGHGLERDGLAAAAVHVCSSA